ncbi:hypothetical protein [Streptomyces sp. DH12]|uniref:hypothetical protein n=1 Tax=Streptomyces sp. DH12 TaxID=2857010 RepID=UPI001E644E80|nr:hypothetical protein [Streptomyces sp. DH12]
MSNALPASQAEYDRRMRELEDEGEIARKTYIEAKKRYDRICDEMRNLRISWRKQQTAVPAVQGPKPAGLVLKSRAYPDRIKPHRGRHTHAATYASGLLMRTACSKTFEEENVDHLYETDPVTCPGCQGTIQSNY